MKFLQEFRDFINRGNVIDLAVGIVVGAAFTTIVNSLVADLLTPILGILMGGVNFSGLVVGVGNEELAYGNFIQAVINFIIVSLAVFILVRLINRFYRREAKKVDPPPTPTAEVVLLTEIRDLLKGQAPQSLPPADPRPTRSVTS